MGEWEEERLTVKTGRAGTQYTLWMGSLYVSLNASLCCIQRVLRKVEKRAKASPWPPIIRIWLSVFQLENGVNVGAGI